jgi:hypothetical protein
MPLTEMLSLATTKFSALISDHATCCAVVDGFHPKSCVLSCFLQLPALQWVVILNETLEILSAPLSMTTWQHSCLKTWQWSDPLRVAGPGPQRKNCSFCCCHQCCRNFEFSVLGEIFMITGSPSVLPLALRLRALVQMWDLPEVLSLKSSLNSHLSAMISPVSC